MDQSSSLASSNPISYLENEHKTPPITSFSKSMKNSNVPENRPSLSGNSNQNSNINNNNININNNNNKVTTTKLNASRKSSRGIAKYGSWGYMMLGMLMCSILLLLCGIWGEFVEISIFLKVPKLISNLFTSRVYSSRPKTRCNRRF